MVIIRNCNSDDSGNVAIRRTSQLSPIVLSGCSGFTWLTGPACTELEMAVTDWLGKMVGLPKEFLFDWEEREGAKAGGSGGGGGIIHGTAAEANAFAVVCARDKLIKERTDGGQVRSIRHTHARLPRFLLLAAGFRRFQDGPAGAPGRLHLRTGPLLRG